ncbi:MAG TPA: purine-nucleoside phosphorylase [Ktedonobacterales bacterium]|nr:purine-nucleoside phosphorylase [Ktedonobacterales bacterium]
MQGSDSIDSPFAIASEAAEAIRQRHAEAPRVAIVLGTGLGGLADRIASPTIVPYADIPHFPRSTVAGHAGRLVLGRIGSVHVAAMQGRFHLYEGYTPEQVVLPVRALRVLGAEALIVTNAAGGLDPSQHAGDLLLLRDHIGLPTMAGRNPLVGANDERLGPRFPAMTSAYDADLATLAREVAGAQGTPLREGVYAMVSGPNYESPAELRFLRAIGADAVGMSTVPEVIAARHMGMRVLAISVITNVALGGADATPEEPSHLEVVATAEAAGTRLAALIEGVIERL